MITIGRNKKILLFDVSTEGIGFNDLEFWFRVYHENVVYSFKGELLEGENKVKVVVPPITKMINKEYLDLTKIYSANLEVIGEGKYFINTWEGELKLETDLCVGTKLVSETTQKENKKEIKQNSKNVISTISEEKEEEDKPEEKIEAETVKENTSEEIQENDQEEISENVIEDKKIENKSYNSSLLEEVLNNKNRGNKKPKSKEDILAELM